MKPSITVKQKVPCGYIYATFVEHNNGNFYRLFLEGDITKGSCGTIWLDATQTILTFALRRAFEEDAKDATKEALNKGILKHWLRNKHLDGACPKYFASKDMAYSCTDGIGRCIKAYLNDKKNR
jgi:hypothetical protein